MKKIILLVVASSLLSLTGCLDSAPVSSITDANMWQAEGQFSSFVFGVHNRLRENMKNMYTIGDLRSDIYSDKEAYPGEAASMIKVYCLNLLSEEQPGLSNYADIYDNINQINLYISKTTDTNVLNESSKKYSLGQMYGLRAFYYFHLLRTWGNVVWNESPSLGFATGGLEKPVSPASEIMTKIKNDIDRSTDYFGDDYSFQQEKSFWSKAATLMLKAEVYLWSARQMGGEAADATVAKNALTDIQSHVSGLGLMDKFKDVFAYKNKGNKEILFAIRYKENEMTIFNQMWMDGMLPNKASLGTFYDGETSKLFDVSIENFDGRITMPTKPEAYTWFDDDDSRKKATLKAVYTKPNDVLKYAGCFAYKYQGTTPAGETKRYLGDDLPIYRYADLLLMLAEAKALLSENPTKEINEVRERAYGDNYDENMQGYPHQEKDNDINEALLQERLREFLYEGKRWYDLRRFGDKYVFKYTTADPQHPKRLLWPVDKTTMTNNPAIHQTDGYASTITN